MTRAIAVAAALGAAGLYAVASVLQQREAARQPPLRSLSVGLLLRLAARPLWLAGYLADFAGYGLQFLALSFGSLILVQPLLVTGLVFALPLSAVVDRRRISKREAGGAAAVAVGIALFLVVGAPGAANAHTTALQWAIVLGACLGSATLMLWSSTRARPPGRAALLGAAAGTLFGLTAALTEATADLLPGGSAHLLTAWQPYALLVVGAANLVVAQNAFQGGPLAWSLPTLTVVETLTSVAIGALAFKEDLSTHAFAVTLEVLGVMVMAAGVVVIARVSSLSSPSVPAAN